jgi:hypothetical protein
MCATIQDPIQQQAGSTVGNVDLIHPLGLGALALLCVLALLLPRRHSTLPLVILLCFVPSGQRLIAFTLDLSFLRILLVAIWIRLLLRGELRPITWNWLDRWLLLWAAAVVVTGTLQQSTAAAFINRAGYALDAWMVYLWIRQHVRSHADTAVIAGQFLACSPFVLALLLLEHTTGRNALHVFGGVPELTDLRDGRLRCQGAFAHPIVAGCFFACLIPLYAIRGMVRGNWVMVTMGCLTAIGIVGLTASSTPAAALVFAAFGAACFWIRHALVYLRWMALLVLVSLHFLRTQPIWHLLARVDLAGGSTGWHRYHLIDEFLHRVPEWWWLGTPQTGHWGLGLHDVTDQYVAEAVGGGFVRLTLFFAVLVTAFRAIGKTMRAQGAPRWLRSATWALGTALFVHSMNFLAISYFEQIVVLWHLTLGIVGSTTLVPGAKLRG